MLVINNFDNNNKLLLLTNLVIANGNLFETPEISDKYPERVGDVQITSVRKGQTFEDSIDGECTTVVEGKALVALNMCEAFRLVLCTDGFAQLVHFNRVPPVLGREAQEVILGTVSLLIK